MKRFAQRFGLATVMVLSATLAHAATADHLQCLKIKKDAIAKAKYTADVTPSDNTFAAATGCTIKLPAKLLCVDSTQTNTAPTPPGAGAGSAGQKYLCYTAKCPTDRPSTSLTDQFGVHAITVSGTSMVCAPVLSPPTCTDGFENGSETDVDCGGTCSPCANGLGCQLAGDCASGICASGTCQAPAATCTDGIKNGSETDLDCGGSCPKCVNGLDCLVAGDCASGTCASGTCQACSNDGQCVPGAFCQGGLCTPAKANGQPCTTDNQCSSSHCVSGSCCASACVASAPSTCGYDGTCTLSGAACNYYSATTACVGGTCNGFGACQP